MTTQEKIDAIRLILGCSVRESDECLKLYLNLAKEKILKRRDPFNAHNLTEIPTEYESIQLDLAVFLLSKRGAEGESQHTENSISRVYMSEDKLLRQIVPLAGMLR